MKTKQKNNQAGFSLVELMVVVAIIGILATIAVPNFQRFQAKAKQSNAKVELSGVYTAQKAFYTEYSSYYWHLAAIGFMPEGFAPGTAANASSTANLPNRYYTTSAGNGGGNWPTQLGAAPTSTAYNQFTYGNYYAANTTLCTGANAVPAGAVTAANTFLAVSSGCPRAQNQTSKDVWTMTQDKALANTTAGI